MKKHYLMLPSFLKFNVFYRCKLEDYGQPVPEGHVEAPKVKSVPQRTHPYDANLISSEKDNGRHMLCLDLDQQHWYKESSTPDHGHLVINADLSKEDLKEIIDVLAKHGIVQDGIKKQIDDRGFLSLRMPGMTKYDDEDNMSLEEYKKNLESKLDIPKLENKIVFDFSQCDNINMINRFAIMGFELVELGIFSDLTCITVKVEDDRHYLTFTSDGNVFAEVIGTKLIMFNDVWPDIIWQNVKNDLLKSKYIILD